MAVATRINMAEAIRGPWEHIVITSFGVDLGFFERAILPQLAHTRGRLILADADHLLAHHADAARGRFVRYLNRGYHTGGIHVAGVSHAKLILFDLRGRWTAPRRIGQPPFDRLGIHRRDVHPVRLQ